MKYVIDLPKKLLEKIRGIIDNGEYEGINEFIITALENQITLEGSEIVEEDLFSSTLKMPKILPPQQVQKRDQKQIFRWVAQPDNSKIMVYPTPDLKSLNWENTDYNQLWLWGQINRLFTVKVGLRILAHMQQSENNYIPLSKFKTEASEIAREIGLQLNQIDRQLNRKRDSQVSTGLPIGPDKKKSELRYKSHFLASIRTDKVLDGAMARLKFVNIKETENEDYLIGMTKEGLEFTLKQNPILDVNINSERTLSDDEIEYYLNHIKENVPDELNPIQNILTIVKNGAKSADEIDAEIKTIKPNWSETSVTTNRSGALSRMTELGLLKKTKKGIYVTYSLSDKGNYFLESLE